VTSRSFPHNVTSVQLARDFVSQELACLPADLRETARLLVSELVTNALLYSSGDFEVSTSCEPGSTNVRVSVSDKGVETPQLLHPGPFQEHGRGLQLVAAFSDSWGAEPSLEQDRKTIWFEIASHPRRQGRVITAS